MQSSLLAHRQKMWKAHPSARAGPLVVAMYWVVYFEYIGFWSWSGSKVLRISGPPPGPKCLECRVQ
uniref:Uncharacterized protein n=1 Tax=Romanomermis culicivorax TaxID=13658 RepID=A0A915ISQ8_ROMCU